MIFMSKSLLKVCTRSDLYQPDLLLSLGCKNAQGYYYGKPQPSDEFLRLFV